MYYHYSLNASWGRITTLACWLNLCRRKSFREWKRVSFTREKRLRYRKHFTYYTTRTKHLNIRLFGYGARSHIGKDILHTRVS